MTDRKIIEFFTPRSAKRQRSASSPELTPENLNTNPERRVKITCEMEDVAVSSLTMGQLLEGLNDNMSKLLDQKLVNLVTKQDLTVLSSEVTNLSEECKHLKEDISVLRADQQRLVARINDLESRSRRNNLVFRGLKWSGRTDFRVLLRQFCADRFGTTDSLWINRAHPLGVDGKAIIAHLPDDTDIDYIMSRAKDLSGTGFAVHRDYSRDVREKRAHLMAVRAEIERVCGRRKMPIVHDHLIVENTRFTWEEKQLMAGRQNGADKLHQVLGRDFTDFLSKLAQDGPRNFHPRNAQRMAYATVAAAAPAGEQHGNSTGVSKSPPTVAAPTHGPSSAASQKTAD
jgi:hypothetical protein